MGDLTRTAARAALSAVAAILVSRFITLQRPYWTILVAVVVTNDTLGSSLRKTFQRIGMTSAGCVAGWSLHQLTLGRPDLEMVFLLAAIFLAAYFRKGSYPWMTFYLTVYVAFLFTVTGQWTPALMLTRLLDTGYGAGIAILMLAVIPPARVAHALEDDLRGFWKQCREHAEAAASLLCGEEPAGYDWLGRRRDLLIEAEKLRARQTDVFYETLLQVRSRKRHERIMGQTSLLCHHTLGFGRAARLRGVAVPGFAVWRDRILSGFERLGAPKPDDLAPAPVARPAWPRNLPEPVFYFGRRMDELLGELRREL